MFSKSPANLPSVMRNLLDAVEKRESKSVFDLAAELMSLAENALIKKGKGGAIGQDQITNYVDESCTALIVDKLSLWDLARLEKLKKSILDWDPPVLPKNASDADREKYGNYCQRIAATQGYLLGTVIKMMEILQEKIDQEMLLQLRVICREFNEKIYAEAEAIQGTKRSDLEKLSDFTNKEKLFHTLLEKIKKQVFPSTGDVAFEEKSIEKENTSGEKIEKFKALFAAYFKEREPARVPEEHASLGLRIIRTVKKTLGIKKNYGFFDAQGPKVMPTKTDIAFKEAVEKVLSNPQKIEEAVLKKVDVELREFKR